MLFGIGWLGWLGIVAGGIFVVWLARAVLLPLLFYWMIMEFFKPQ